MDDFEYISIKINHIEALIKEQIMLGKEMLNLEETSKYLDLASSYIYKLTSLRKIPHYSPGGKKLFFKRSELDAWLQQNRKMTSEEYKAEAVSYVMKGGKK